MPAISPKQPTLPDQLLSAALAYAEMGYKVFPCQPGGKTPITESGLLDATSDPDQIAAWWCRTPQANIGLATEGLVVIDVDGAANPWLADQPDLQTDLAIAPISRTPRGGRHYIFRQPEGAGVRNSANKIAPKVDVRAGGGYIVAPPSVVEGKPYAFYATNALSCGPEALPEPPGWLMDLLHASAAPRASVAATVGNHIPEGNRNQVLTSMAGALRRSGLSQSEILAALYQINADRCHPPLVDREVEKIAASVARYEPNQVATALAEGAGTAPIEQLKPISVRKLLADHPDLRPPILHGLLRVGETMNLIAPSKVGKSWLVTDLALSVVTGRPWLETFQAERGDVLILDNELHPETMANRIPKVAKARGIPIDAYADRLHTLSLRGRLLDLFSLGRLFDTFEHGRYKVIICDAFYRFLPPKTDENDNGTMAHLYNHLDNYASRLGSSFILIHHSSKGNQSGKSVIDVGAGAGSQGRAADAHIVLRRHEEEDVVVLEGEVRSWPKFEPRCLRWDFPTWQRADDLDPAQLQTDSGGKKKAPKDESDGWTVEAFVASYVTETPRTRSQIIDKAVSEGMSTFKARTFLKSAYEDGWLVRTGTGKEGSPHIYAKKGLDNEL